MNTEHDNGTQARTEQGRETYATPRLAVHGPVAELTQGQGGPFADPGAGSGLG